MTTTTANTTGYQPTIRNRQAERQQAEATIPGYAEARQEAKLNLYDLGSDALRVQRLIADTAEALTSDDPAEQQDAITVLEALLLEDQASKEALAAKADAYCWVIDQLHAQAAYRKEQAKRLTELARRDERRAQSLTDRLIGVLTRLEPDATKFELPAHRIASRKSQQVEIDVPVSALPLDCVVTRYEPNKTALKELLKSGQEIEGVVLVEHRSWTIR